MKCVQHFPNTLPGNGHKTVTSASSTAAHHSTAIWTSIMGRTTEWAALHRRALRQGRGGEKGELQRVLILSRWWAPLVMQRHSQRATAMKRVACATTKMLHKRPTSRSKQRNLLLSHFKSSLLSPFLRHLPQPLLHPFLTVNLCVCVCTANYEWPKFVSTLLRPQMNCQYTYAKAQATKNLFSGSRRPQICPRTQLLLNYGNCGHRTRHL